VKRLWIGAVALMIGTMGTAQSMGSQPQTAPPGTQSRQPDVQSSRNLFGQMCGIANTAAKSAIGVSRSPQGVWSVVTAGKRPAGANVVARVWRENNWMVDMHGAPGNTVHTAQMCFAANGQMTMLIDRFMDFSNAYLRVTALNFDASGKEVRREQSYMNAETGAAIARPEAANGFPAVFGARRVEQLPFYFLLKK
jgi:hypothetical protein